MFSLDRHIAIQAGWIAGPAFGVAMMAAPEYLHLGPIASAILFWGGIAVFLLTIVVVVVISLHEEGKRKTVLGPITTMVIGALIFCGGAAWYFWPSHAVPQKPWKHTLEELYLSDFSDLLSLERKLDTTISDKNRGLEPVTVQIRLRDYQDFRSNTDFLSLYIPVSNDIRIDDRIYEIIRSVRDQLRNTRDDLHNSVGIGMGSGTSYSESKNLTFSGRVFIYTSQPFTVIQLGELASWYHAAGMSLEIRGHDYWWANKDR